ncbi:MAG: DUF998 domain-containing protein [Candidatus Lokiarchaeota archaeon]|nr:DUF998 domain-containing protein [Candidatus Lokiarchaeota archaeon]
MKYLSMSNLTKILTGNADRETHRKYFFVVMLIFWSGCLLSQLFFPGGYSILDNYISDMGWIAVNPVGCWFFIVGGTLTGILFIPHCLYIHRKLMPDFALFSYLSTFSCIVGSIGLMIVALFTKDDFLKHVHDVAADVAFGGFGIGAFFMMFVLIRKIIIKADWPKIYQFLIIYGGAIILGAVLLNIENNTLQQWMGLFTLMYWLIGIYLSTMVNRDREIKRNG